MAEDHRAGSKALRDAEASACAGVSELDRDTSPFGRREDIIRVEPLKSTGRSPQLLGATVTFRAVPGLTVEWLERDVGCHLARNAALGHNVPEMDYCPLVPKGVTASVKPAGGGGVVVEVKSEDSDTAMDVLRRAELAARAGGRTEGTAPTATGPLREHHMGMTGMDGMCPMKVQGASVTSENVENGVALVFTTQAGDVAELRRRVHHMAEMHNQHRAGGMMGGCPQHRGGSGGMGGMMMGGGMMPAATASVVDVEGGARLTLHPQDESQLEALRQHVQMCAQAMGKGECPMMAPGAEGAPSEGTPAPSPQPGR
ncbi:MAG: hypothetical protein HY901_31580 [Deltaproteobacteria bacterium]|nr:hypothetical protein [Deltaproteobacteria bacterium]